MDSSATIIGIIIALIIIIPIYLMIRSQSVFKKKIKGIKDYYSRNNHFTFGQTETQNKKVLALDPKNKAFLLIDFNVEPEQVSFIDLNEVSSCKLVPTTEGNSNTIIKLDFEFALKNSGNQSITFYNIDRDQIGQVYLYQDHQLAKKWTRILQEVILR